MNKSVFDDHANECTVIIPATKRLASRGGGGGAVKGGEEGAGHSLMWPIRDVPLDRVCFFCLSALNRTVYNFRQVCPIPKQGLNLS